MANTTYTSVAVVDTPAKRRAAYDNLAVFCVHIFNYGIDLVSITFDGTTKLITIVVTGPIPNQAQINRYGIA